MSKEKLAERSRPYYTEFETPFTDKKNYLKDASRAISIGALLIGDQAVLDDLARTGNIYYWLIQKSIFDNVKYEGITHRFEGIKEEKRWVFTRLGDSEKVRLGKFGVRNLVIQYDLTQKQIKTYGWVYGVPNKKDIE